MVGVVHPSFRKIPRGTYLISSILICLGLGFLVPRRKRGTYKRGTYDENPKSKACVSKNEGHIYYYGGFNGGSTDQFLAMSNCLKTNIDADLQNDVIALWHDESHLNRYFIDHPPAIVLSPSYSYPEKWNLPFEKKILALKKDHKSMREKK